MASDTVTVKIDLELLRVHAEETARALRGYLAQAADCSDVSKRYKILVDGIEKIARANDSIVRFCENPEIDVSDLED